MLSSQFQLTVMDGRIQKKFYDFLHDFYTTYVSF